ncbi:MAG: hypothetical protein E6J89_02680 [Deltaproteobacteria bacterium]|nr:MAG: hypothetical protein E6J89_02680 [Deltaproteobacteria bacterium]
MQEQSSGGKTGSPEMVVGQLVLRLKRHAFGDLLLAVCPPFLVACYLAFYLRRAAWITQATLSFAAVALIVVALLLAVRRHFSMVPPASLAARFIDDKVGAKERFLTLATMGLSHSPSFLVARLRQEATTFLNRIDLGRDFPYRVKRSFVASLIASLAVVLLFHLILLSAVFLAPQAQPTKELALLAEKLAETPRLSSLARRLMSLAERLEQEKLSDAEKHALVQELSKEVQKQLRTEQQEQSSSNDLLSQAGNALQKLEQGEGEKQEQQKGGGGIKSNLPDKGEGQGEKQSKGGGEGDQRDSSLSESKNLQGGKSAQGETKEPGAGQGDKGKNQGRDDKLRDEKQRGKESETAKGEQEGKSSKNTSEEIPHGPPPAERFAKPGEGEGGIKGARFVTVELPEPEAERSSGERGSGKKKAIQPHVPVSNVPLRPADSPEASAEKQPLPLEYRDLIR